MSHLFCNPLAMNKDSQPMTISRRAILAGAAATGTLGLSTRNGHAAETPYGLKPGKPYAGTQVNIILPNAGQYRAQAKRLPQFTDLTGIKANFIYVPYATMLDKITTDAVSGGSAYDVITYQDSWGPSLVPYMDPIEDRIARDGFDMGRYPAVYKQAGTYGGMLYGVPLRAHPQLLFYRKDLLAQAGQVPPKTFAELVTVARAVQDKTGVPGIAMDYVKGAGGQNLFLWLNYLWGAGSDIFAADGRARFNDAAGIMATEMYTGLLLKEKVANPSSVQFNESDMVNSMAQGTSAMIMQWWWAYPVLTSGRSTLKPEQVGFTTMPSMDLAHPASVTTGMPFSLSKASKNKDAAWEYMKWMCNPDLELDIATDKSDPDTNEIMVTHAANFQNAKLNEINNGLHRAGLACLAAARPMPQIREWPQVAAVLEVAISDICSGGKPVKVAMDDAATQVDRVMRRSGSRAP